MAVQEGGGLPGRPKSKGAVPAHLWSKIAAFPPLCPYPMNCIYDLVPHNIAYLLHLRQWLYPGILNPAVTASQLE